MFNSVADSFRVPTQNPPPDLVQRVVAWADDHPIAAGVAVLAITVFLFLVTPLGLIGLFIGIDLAIAVGVVCSVRKSSQEMTEELSKKETELESKMTESLRNQATEMSPDQKYKVLVALFEVLKRNKDIGPSEQVLISKRISCILLSLHEDFKEQPTQFGELQNKVKSLEEELREMANPVQVLEADKKTN